VECAEWVEWVERVLAAAAVVTTPCRRFTSSMYAAASAFFVLQHGILFSGCYRFNNCHDSFPPGSDALRAPCGPREGRRPPRRRRSNHLRSFSWN
jgi:hypothetical protein